MLGKDGSNYYNMATGANGRNSLSSLNHGQHPQAQQQYPTPAGHIYQYRHSEQQQQQQVPSSFSSQQPLHYDAKNREEDCHQSSYLEQGRHDQINEPVQQPNHDDQQQQNHHYLEPNQIPDGFVESTILLAVLTIIILALLYFHNYNE